MTTKELEAQIIALQSQLKSLEEQLGGSQDYKTPQEGVKNYEHLLNEAEGSFLKKEYLEAFLIQSCIIEGVIKEYASKKLLSIIKKSSALENKFKNFELARLIDDLFISGKIKNDLYEELSAYRKKRNEVIHSLLEYEDKTKLDEELKEAYEKGKHMKGFIVDDINNEMKESLSAAELEIQVSELLSQLSQLQSQLMK